VRAGLLLVGLLMQTQASFAGPAAGTSGLVSSAHPLASEAGVRILRAGGNAFDAAVAVAAALNVVEPMMSGIGGYGTIIIYDAKKREARFLNSSGRIPRAVDSDAFRPPTPGYLENRRGAKSVSTPGNVAAWEAMSRGYGKLAWKRLFAQAIRLARDGFPIDERTAKMIGALFEAFPPHARRFYGREGRPLAAGDRLVQKDLARSFERIAAQGARELQNGEIARAIEGAMRAAGGFLSLKDLEANQAEWGQPIKISYRGYELVTAPPPANSFDMLVRLGLMSRYDLRGLGHNSAAFLHHFAEATKHGFWVRLRYAGDPEVNMPPLDRLLSSAYFAEEAAKIDPQRARPFTPPQSFQADEHTTHFVVADRWGNVVSATQTLGGLFGSKIMPEGTGIWLNDSLEFCTFEPKGNPMDAHPGRRKLSGDCPTLIMKEGRPWVAIGTPGGHTIGQTVPQMIMNLIDFQMDIQQAIAAGRISFIEPSELAVEESIPEGVRRELAAKGHKVRVRPNLGNAHGLTIEYDRRGKPIRFRGAADPRGRGQALGY
jgi:gamma-glutamyltranspeptidase/glutathione hydrolase